mgnify:CR=1 FL=1
MPRCYVPFHSSAVSAVCAHARVQAEFVDILGSAVRTRAKKRARGGKQEAKEDTNMKALKKMRVRCCT